MNIPSWSSWRPTRPFLYSLFVISILASKVLHLFQHGRSLGFLRFLAFFPTFFIPDILVAIPVRIILNNTSTGILSTIGLVVGAFLSLLCFVASSCQLGFYYVTGAEMQWDAATSVASDPVAVRLMMTGIVQVMVAGLAILVISFATTPFLYNKVGAALAVIASFVAPSNWTWDKMMPSVRVRPDQTHQRVIRIWPIVSFVVVLFLLTLQAVRPRRPYNHISSTLPFSLLRIIHSPHADACGVLDGTAFPFPEMVDRKHWEMPNGNFKGWAPGKNAYLSNEYKKRRPKWLPEELPSGFERWAPQEKPPKPRKPPHHDHHEKPPPHPKCGPEHGPHYYNPVADPLRITNLDLDVYEPLRKAMEDASVLISHIVLVSMESGRKELFPLRQGTDFYDMIFNSHETVEDPENLQQKLFNMTPVARQITGEGFWSDPENEANTSYPEPEVWQDSAAPGMGGLNVKGAVTGSTLSFKSVLGSHCGVFPLPVDFLEEVTTKSYQPCIPQIMNLFNRAKESPDLQASAGEQKKPQDPHRADVHKRAWRTLNVQSTTDQYDRQREMNRNMNFSEMISRETMDSADSKYYDSKAQELNYFGYPDTDAEPIFRDAIFDAAENGTRLFLSHFTSATHHPWKVPKGFKRNKYMGSGNHQNMNSYLNTIRYIDGWLGDILGLLDEAGIANETLVVYVGDHGQAFEEDHDVTGTFENGHISNFRVPIVFRNPLLPRIDIEANATSMSILPTILDLLVHSDSLDAYDTSVASDLVHEYQGQSLLRPFKTSHNSRQVWNIGIINAGGSMISVSSAAVPWRLVLPLKSDFMYSFSDLSSDPHELQPLQEWSLDMLLPRVQEKYSEEAKTWLEEANGVAEWWVNEMHRLWNYEKKS